MESWEEVFSAVRRKAEQGLLRPQSPFQESPVSQERACHSIPSLLSNQLGVAMRSTGSVDPQKMDFRGRKDFSIHYTGTIH